MAEKPTYEQLEKRVEDLTRENAANAKRIAELKESENRYYRMLDNLKEEFLFYRHDTNGVFTYVSPSYANILGYSPDEYVNKNVENVWTSNPINKGADRRTKLSCMGIRQPPYEIEVYHKSGARRRFETIETPILNGQGKVIAVEGTARDITEKRKIEEKLEKYRKHLEDLVQQRTTELQTSQKQLFDIIDFLPDPTYVIDRNDVVIAWNRAMVGITGLSKKQVVGQKYHRIIRALYSESDPLLIEMVLNSGPTEDEAHSGDPGGGFQEYGIRRQERNLFAERFISHLHGGKGGYVWITAAPILDSNKQILGAIESIRDVTQIKQAERKIRQSERRLSTLMSNLPGMAYRIVQEDSQWRVAFVSEGCKQIFGYDPSFFIDRNVKELRRLLHSDDLNRVVQKALEAVKERKTVQSEYRILTATDETKWVFDKAEAVMSRSTGRVSVEGFMADFTVYKQMEQRLKTENTLLRSTIRDRVRFMGIIGNCQAMQDVFELIVKAATTDDNVFVSGESGTGKELVAQAIHKASNRKDKNFVAVNCAAIPEDLIESEFFGAIKGAYTGAVADKKGYLEEADGGTLFLDEIGDISPSLQVKLLRAIDGGGFSPIGSRKIIRPKLTIVAATNKNVEQLLSSGSMRQDFFFRIHVIPIHLPPLRERGDDIIILINHFLKEYSTSDDITTLYKDDLETLKNYSWPGNVRELQNVIRRYLALKNLQFMKIEKAPSPHRSPLSDKDDLLVEQTLKASTEEFEKKLIIKTLNTTKWNKTKAAEMLGVSRKTLFRKMKTLGLM